MLKSLTIFTCGGFLGVVFIDLLPRITNSRKSGELIILAILGFFTLDKEISNENLHMNFSNKKKSDEEKNNDEKDEKKSI